MKCTSLLAAGSTAAMLLGGTVASVAQTYSTTVIAPSQVLQYTVTTNAATSPTFNRPTAGTPPAGLSGVGTAVAYATDANPLDANTTSFIPTASGVYQINTTVTSGYASDDFEQFLYAGAPAPFVPASPLTNVKVGVLAPAFSTSFNYSVTAGTTYQLVNAGYYNASDTAPADISVGTSTTTVTNLGSTMAIPDPTETIVGAGTNKEYATYTPTPISQTLTVTDTTTIGTFNGITIIGLQHPSLGDLTATLMHNGVTVDLFDHTGASAANYNQGSQAKFDGGNYTFATTGASLAGVADFAVAPDGTYMATGNAATGFDKANAGNTLNAFAGMSVAGAWTLTFTDEQVDDTGTFQGFRFNVTPAAAPEPSEFAGFGVGLLGLGALALRARRRRQAA